MAVNFQLEEKECHEIPDIPLTSQVACLDVQSWALVIIQSLNLTIYDYSLGKLSLNKTMRSL